MTIDERMESLEKRVAQCETDIVNLADVIQKFTDGVSKLQAIQAETMVVLSKIMPKSLIPNRPQ